jgi:chromosome segregation ATPase
MFSPKSSPFTTSEPDPAMISTATQPNQTESNSTSPAPHPPQNGADSPPSAAEDKLSTIRNLLVGDQINVLNDRFATLESSLQSHSNELVHQIKAKFDAAYTLYKVELEEMGEKVTALRNENDESSHELQRLNERLNGMEKNHDELKNEVSRQMSGLYDEFSKNINEFTAVMKEQYDELSSRMVAKTDLANLFGNLSAAAIGKNPNQDQDSQG